MAAFKAVSVFLILLVAASMVIDVTEAATRISPCDQVCSRIVPERNECCRSHGRSGYSHCSRGMMYCN